MIIVLGDEERQIQNSDSYIKARMQRGSLHERFIVIIKSLNKRHSLLAKRREDILDRVRVMIRFVRLAILHVGGPERFASRFEIIEAAHSQRLKVEQMPGLFLN